MYEMDKKEYVDWTKVCFRCSEHSEQTCKRLNDQHRYCDICIVEFAHAGIVDFVEESEIEGNIRNG